MKKLSYLYLLLFLSACSGGSSAPLIAPPKTIEYINNNNLPANFDIQGHRGARGIKAENTLPAFETALDLGVSTLELDLHFTSDHHLIIWHDDKISSKKCSSANNKLLSQLNLNQVKAITCKRNPDASRFPFQNNATTELAGSNYQIITLDELFRFINIYANSSKKSELQRNNAKQIHFNIETKRTPNFPTGINDHFDGINPGAFELAILDTIKKHHFENRVIIQSFDHRSLWAIRSINNTIQLAALTNRNTTDPTSYAISGANIWSPNYQYLNKSLLDKAHNANLKVIPWTVNNTDSMRTLINMGVDGMITDRPDLLLSLGKL